MGRAIKVQKSCTNHMVWFYLKNHLVLAACFISQDKGQEPSQQKITNWDPGFYQLMLQRFIGEMPGTFQLCALLNVEYPTILFEDLIHYLLNVGLVCRWMHGVLANLVIGTLKAPKVFIIWLIQTIMNGLSLEDRTWKSDYTNCQCS